MASYFGEVLETPSRAYNEDIIDDELKGAFKSEYEISWESSHRPEEIDLCFVIAGKCSRAFSALLRRKTSPQLIAKISQVQKRGEGECSTLKDGKEIPSYIYMLKTGVYLCEVSPGVQLTQANFFTAKLHELLELSKEVIVLASVAAVQYLSLDANDPPFIKGLCNSKYLTSGKELLAPKMEPPNLITGVAAAVLMFCEIKQISGCLYACYTLREEFDSEVYGLLKKLFSQVQSLESTVTGLKYEGSDLECFPHRAGNLYL